METRPRSNKNSLLEFDIPPMNEAQLKLFKYEGLRAKDEGAFDLDHALERLRAQDGALVIGIDIGGDKAVTQLFKITKQGLVVDNTFSDLRKDKDGAGYAESLAHTATFARENNIPVGMSIGIPLDGSKPADPTKLPALQADLAHYGGDFRVLIPNLEVCLNDGPAGVISGAIHANLSSHTPVNEVIYIINGGGIGAAVLKDGKIVSTEAGHTVPVVDSLNRYDDHRECGVFGATHTCFELVASNKQGIEAVWARKTGQPINAIEIEKHYTQHREKGDLSLELYENSALLIAHLAKGLSQAFNVNLSNPTTALVGHGGAFKFPNYGARVKQIIDRSSSGENTNLLLTNSYSKNACLDGAALAAITI